jgi:hypothetical protein
MIGFAGVDASDPDARRHIREAKETGFRGLTLSPALQDYHPADTRAMKVYEEAARLGMPILIHQGMHYAVSSNMTFADPVAYDEVAREFGELKIILGYMGYPWIDQTLCLLGKHPNVLADIAGLLKHSWKAYTTLLQAYEYGVIDKLLFGSDFPYASPTECIEALYSVNQFAHAANLPSIPREMLRSIVERDALNQLGIRCAGSPGQVAASIAIEDEEDA